METGKYRIGLLAIFLLSFYVFIAVAEIPPLSEKRFAVPASEEGLMPPLQEENPSTPETRTLSKEEADQALRRDWYHQAMGVPLLERIAQEIKWTKELAARLSGKANAPDFTLELKELEKLERRYLAIPANEDSSSTADPELCWIWHPEKVHAPPGTRYFRYSFEMSESEIEKIQQVKLHMTADDRCELFINGTKVGKTRNSGIFAVLFPVDKQLLQKGSNILAVKAKNTTFSYAGLIVCLTIELSENESREIVTTAMWRSCEKEEDGWKEMDFNDSSWGNAEVVAPWWNIRSGPFIKAEGLDARPGFDAEASYAHVNSAIRELYLDVRRLKREIMFKNPLLDFNKIVLIDQPYPRGRYWHHEAILRLGCRATPGGRLLLLDGLHPGGKVKQLAPGKPGSFWRPDVSYDGKRVLFSYKAHDEKSFHLYEMNLDGTGLRQITNSDYDDVDPAYLPDGRIVFTTTRGNTYVRCGPFIYSNVLARCDADGSNLYIISMNNEPDMVPSVMADGRIIYTRWEYTDKPLWRAQGLWTTNPDGTGTSTFWGNQSVWPDVLGEPRAIPGSRRVMFTGVGHHDWMSGSIGIVDPSKGNNFPHGLTKVTADLRWAESNNPPKDPIESEHYHASGKFKGYMGAYPLSEEDFLVSAWLDDNRRQFKLYLMDVHGNRDLIYEGEHNAWYAMPVKPRPKPRNIPDRTVWPGTGKDRKPNKPGIFYSANVFEGVSQIPKGLVKYLRVFQQDAKTYSTWFKTFMNSGPAISPIQEDGVKRVVTVVPVEDDGSVYFEAPSGKALHFQLLDKEYRAVHTMRSFTGLMPGEHRGCVGCHEMQATTPSDRPSIALRRAPTPITPPPWGDESVGYERFVQPVLDRYCGECHQGEGKGRKKLDLTLRPGRGVFKEPYLTLVGPAVHIPGGNGDRKRAGYGLAGIMPVESMSYINDPVTLGTIGPMTYLSYKSKLIEMASSGKHHDVKVDELSLRRLKVWIDAMAPYQGEEEIRALGDPEFPGIERLPIRPRVSTAPEVLRP